MAQARSVLHSACVGHWLLHLHLQSGPDLNQMLEVSADTSSVCSAMLPDHSSTFQTGDDVKQNASRTAQLYFGAKRSVLLSWDS